MIFPPFALLTFETSRLALEEAPSLGGTGQGSDQDLQAVLDEHPDQWVRLRAGTYVFATGKAWHRMHVLLEALHRKQKQTGLVYFEQDLFGCFDPATIEKLAALGVVVHDTRIPETLPQSSPSSLLSTYPQ